MRIHGFRLTVHRCDYYDIDWGVITVVQVAMSHAVNKYLPILLSATLHDGARSVGPFTCAAESSVSHSVLLFAIRLP